LEPGEHQFEDNCRQHGSRLAAFLHGSGLLVNLERGEGVHLLEKRTNETTPSPAHLTILLNTIALAQSNPVPLIN